VKPSSCESDVGLHYAVIGTLGAVFRSKCAGREESRTLGLLSNDLTGVGVPSRLLEIAGSPAVSTRS
jgi:hypothetical protein